MLYRQIVLLILPCNWFNRYYYTKHFIEWCAGAHLVFIQFYLFKQRFIILNNSHSDVVWKIICRLQTFEEHMCVSVHMVVPIIISLSIKLKGISLRHVTDWFLIEIWTKRSSFPFWNCAIWNKTTSAYLEAIWRNKLSFINRKTIHYFRYVIETVQYAFAFEIHHVLTTRP